MEDDPPPRAIQSCKREGEKTDADLRRYKSFWALLSGRRGAYAHDERRGEKERAANSSPCVTTCWTHQAKLFELIFWPSTSKRGKGKKGEEKKTVELTLLGRKTSSSPPSHSPPDARPEKRKKGRGATPIPCQSPLPPTRHSLPFMRRGGKGGGEKGTFHFTRAIHAERRDLSLSLSSRLGKKREEKKGPTIAPAKGIFSFLTSTRKVLTHSSSSLRKGRSMPCWKVRRRSGGEKKSRRVPGHLEGRGERQGEALVPCFIRKRGKRGSVTAGLRAPLPPLPGKEKRRKKEAMITHTGETSLYRRGGKVSFYFGER